jgi:tRNA-modifying protein YgfZ
LPGRFAQLNCVFFDLSSRVKLRVTGPDRERFLNGQLSNDVRKATEAGVIEACVLNAKGRLNAHLFATVEGESYLLDADPELRESLQARLDRYIIADDVQIADETGRWAIFHVWPGTAPALPKEFKVRSAIRFLEPGYDVWADAAQRDELVRKLSPGSTFCDAECAEIVRIEKGIPRWGRELSDEIIPIEANLQTRTIDYEKGCYIGQEVISRMKMSGQTNKRLCGLISLKGLPLSAGMRLFPSYQEAKDVGWVTSTAWSQHLGKQIALGYIKRGFDRIGTWLDAIAMEKASAVPVEIVGLPFR